MGHKPWAPKSLHIVTVAMKLKDACSLKVITNLDSVLKSRDNTLPTKARIVKDMVFPVVVYRCESWTLKEALCRRMDAFRIVMLQKTLKSPLDYKETKPVNPKRN